MQRNVRDQMRAMQAAKGSLALPARLFTGLLLHNVTQLLILLRVVTMHDPGEDFREVAGFGDSTTARCR